MNIPKPGGGIGTLGVAVAKDKVLATTDFVGKFHKQGAETVSAEAKLKIWTSKKLEHYRPIADSM